MRMNKARLERLEAKKAEKANSEESHYNKVYKEAKRLSKLANSRVRALKKQGFEIIKAVKLYLRDIKQFNKEVYTQENATIQLTANKKMSLSELQRVISIAKSFLESGMSTKSDIIHSMQFKKARNTFNINYGMNISLGGWANFVELFNNKMYKELYRLLGQQLNYLIVDENNEPSYSKLKYLYDRYLQYKDEESPYYNNYDYLIGGI